ncbi:EXOG Nuclease, partial [Polypterus senegalus]|nr:EXOG Nuclease [Polypterus senegalus]
MRDGTGRCVLLRRDAAKPEAAAHESVLEKYGLPMTGAEIRYYTNHVLSYDQAKRTPKWVIEHLNNEKLLGSANRKDCKFRPDPSIPALFTARNEDYIRSGWSRGHMAPAGDYKYSLQSMTETFYLSNIVPQNYENNAGFWNRLEMYCRELTQRFDDVWIVSGPLMLPKEGTDGSKSVFYKVIGNDEVAVPTHLYKVVLAQRSNGPSRSLALGAFVVPNEPIGFDHQLPEFQMSLEDLEKKSGLTFFPKINQTHETRDLCKVDTCKLMDYKEFKLYITTSQIHNAKTLARLEKLMSELREHDIEPDDYLLKQYESKKKELGSVASQERKSG